MSPSSAPHRELIAVVLGAFAALIVAVMVVVVVVGAPPRAARYVGDVDLQVACDEQYPGEERVLVLRQEGNPYTWSCEAPSGEQDGIEVSEECARLYGDGVYGKIGTSDDPASWDCVSDTPADPEEQP